MIEKRNVDIIIPVYNAFDFTKKCIETVIEHTNLKQNRLILINDKSPDERILPMLESFVEKYKELNIILIEDTTNNKLDKQADDHGLSAFLLQIPKEIVIMNCMSR